ncbi:hypothetical protein DVT68_19815 [Dyella solisilvae]|uniref:Uncharacterized protein n=1 Tax=Dyella solisilvae TaxID=1920168 RepID=A0A370K2N1_9GAMM|nr:hypothetical protein [Dyella solisilvae]RDI96858.1 hypothetical protein DVT68_19815 [Dyella solisilvae]
MDFDLLIKGAGIVIAAVGAAKLLYDVFIGKRGRMREEYSFAKQFLDEVATNKQLHPYLREKGYQAIAGDSQLGADEIEYLLSLKSPQRALRDFVLGHPYVELLSTAGDLKIGFKRKYTTVWSRAWRKYFFGAVYFVLFGLAFFPLLFAQVRGIAPMKVFGSLLVSFGVLGPYAYFSLMASTRVYRAEQLVKNQDKHVQRIVLSGWKRTA